MNSSRKTYTNDIIINNLNKKSSLDDKNIIDNTKINENYSLDINKQVTRIINNRRFFKRQ